MVGVVEVHPEDQVRKASRVVVGAKFENPRREAAGEVERLQPVLDEGLLLVERDPSDVVLEREDP